MKKISGLLGKVLVITLVITMPTLLKVNEAVADIVWSDDFESYTLGTFPSSGGWNLIYDGAGSSYQYVDNTYSTSGYQSLHLVGSYCWGAEAYHPVALPSSVTLEAMVFVDQIVSCGCTPTIATVSLINLDLGPWGTTFGSILLNCDGNIYAIQKLSDRSQDILLIPYNARTWYHVKLDIDLTARVFDVYINGVLRGSGLQILDSGMPTGVAIVASHGGNPTVWFDDVKVSTIPATSCDFSSQPGIERCFGGIGRQCEDFTSKDEETCYVYGLMSVGSILHDRCCLETNNTGWFCLGLFQGNRKFCSKAWDLAEGDVVCGRYWGTRFGPYFTGGSGDDTSKDLKAPSGVRVQPKYEKYCSSGKCQVNAKGKTIIMGKGLCKYCVCQ